MKACISINFPLVTSFVASHRFCMIVFIFIYLFLKLFIYLAALGLRCCARAFSSCSEQGLLFVAVCRFLIVVASLVVEHRL